MNLEGVVGGYSRHRVLTHKIIPLLSLIKIWSAQQEGAMVDTPCILCILQTLQKSLSKRETTNITLESLLEDIKRIFSPTRYDEYRSFLYLLCMNLITFTGLFKDLELLVSTESGREPLMDEKNGVIGSFVRHCIQEYQKMTFSQTVKLQKEWEKFYTNPNSMKESLRLRKKMNRELMAEAKLNKEYTVAKNRVMLPLNQSKAGTAVELKALHLAMLFTQFDHIAESKLVLQEAITVAQMSENNPVLEHSMALLQRFTSVHPSTSRPIISELITHATENKNNLLMSTGKLQLSKVEIQLDSSPVRVMDILSSTEFDVFTSYDDSSHKCAVRSSTLLLKASVLRQYGLRYLSLLPLQMLCHLSKFEQDPSQHRTLDETKAISLLALTLFEEGRLSEAISVIESALHHLSTETNTTRVDTKFLYQCLAELNIQKAFVSDDITNGGPHRKFVKELAVFDPPNARYWEIKELIHFGNYFDAMTKCQQELTQLNIENEKEMNHDKLTFHARYQMLVVEIYTKERLYSRAMNVALECLTFSEEHQLWDIVNTVKLKIANLQLYLGLVSLSKDTVDGVLPVLMAHGQPVEKAIAFFIRAQISLMEQKSFCSTAEILGQSDVQESLRYLSLSLDEVHSSLLKSPIMKKIGGFLTKLVTY